MMTTGTLDTRTTDAALVIATPGTASQAFGAPTAALLAFLLVGQHANAVIATLADRATLANKGVQPSGQLTCAVNSNLFDELLKFHQALAHAQRDLPEDAAKILRDNLWELYD